MSSRKYFGVMVITLLSFLPIITKAGPTTTTTIHFGCNAGGCSGRGVCNSSACNAVPIPVTVSVFAPTPASPNGSYTFTLDLTQELYDEAIQVPYWNTASGTYTFDFPYDVSSDSKINKIVPRGMSTVIPAGVPFPVTTYTFTPADSPGVVHTMATVSANPIRVSSQQTNVMFGLINGSGLCANNVPGIYGVYTDSQQVTLADGSLGTSVPVNFFLKPGAADTLVMTFSDQTMQTNQPEQYQNFNFTTGFYGSAGNSNFSNLLISLGFLPGSVGMPNNSFYSAVSSIRVSQSAGAQNSLNTATDSMFFTYYVFETPFSSTVSIPSPGQLSVYYTMPYTPVVQNVMEGQTTWGNGTISVYSNEGVVATFTGQANASSSNSSPINFQKGDFYYYTITLGCGSYLNATGQLNVTSQQYPIGSPAGAGSSKMQQKSKKKGK